MTEVPHFDFPFRRGSNGKVATVEQDEEGHQVANANVVVRCPTGFRDDRPEFGWPFPEFGNVPLNLQALEDALERFGHSLASTNATEYADAANAARRYVQLEVETT